MVRLDYPGVFAMAMAIPEKFVDAEGMLHDMAMAEVGFTDFGDDDYLTGLRVLLRAIDTDLKLSELSRERVFGLILATLIGRLFSQKGWRENPNCLKTEIRRPLIITGIVRSGTTPLQKVLAMDPQFQGLEYWLTQTPMVRPPRRKWPSHPLYQNTVAGLNAMLQEQPLMAEIHEMAADQPDECLNVMRQSFISNMFASMLNIPSYDEWWMAQDETASYYRHRDNLRLIGYRDQDKRWLLKNPGHTLGIEPLLKVYPDACVVQTHRDPVKAIPSICSLIMMSRHFLVPEADPREDGPRENRLWSIATKRAMEAHDRHPENFHDVFMNDLVEDPLSVIRGIYRRFDLTLVPEVEEKMKVWLEAHAKARPGFHRYTPEEFGLTENQIREQYREYRERYHFA
jgi:Sulfotransferase family